MVLKVHFEDISPTGVDSEDISELLARELEVRHVGHYGSKPDTSELVDRGGTFEFPCIHVNESGQVTTDAVDSCKGTTIESLTELLASRGGIIVTE
ncbi:hypothetical protein KKF55_06150 [Patescibacteria group bacterium]|nr:hypothetical protein [Patescibacteria group bacterium]